MQTDLILLNNGCPEGLRALLLGLTISRFFLPKFLKDSLVSIVIGLARFISKGAVKGAAPTCR